MYELVYEHGGEEPVHLEMNLFKCKDYTTEIVGRYDHNEKAFYVERGDGEKYYYRSGIEWHRPLEQI